MNSGSDFAVALNLVQKAQTLRFDRESFLILYAYRPKEIGFF
jgi:hypothetical protein